MNGVKNKRLTICPSYQIAVFSKYPYFLRFADMTYPEFFIISLFQLYQFTV